MDALTVDLHTAAARFFSGGYTVKVLGFTSGYSGSLFAQVQDATGKYWCLRRWHPEMSVARLKFIHRILQQSRSNGFNGVPLLQQTPDSDTAIRQNAYLYDAQEWINGKPLGKKRAYGSSFPNVAYRLDRTRLIDLTKALATFHTSTAGLSPSDCEEALSFPQQLIQITERFEVFSTSQLTSDGPPSNSRQFPLIGKWLQCLPGLLSLAETLIVSSPIPSQNTSVLCHGDLWPQHVYFNRGHFSGFTDFESVCFSSPIHDLAQLILHFVGWRSRDFVTQIYHNQRSLSDEELALLPAAAALDLLSEGCWAIERLHLSQENNPQQLAHRANLRMLFPSVQLILQESGFEFEQ